MKKILFLILPFLIIFPQKIYGESITTGNASAKSTVTNEVQGGSNVYTKIEVEANGEKKVLETTEPGTHEVKVENNSNATAEAEVEIGNLQNESTNTAKTKEAKSAARNIVQKIFKSITNLFQKILSIFS